jgi:hypothetical protein
VATDDRECAVDEHASLSSYQQDVVEFQVSAAIVLELAHLYKPNDDDNNNNNNNNSVA